MIISSDLGQPNNPPHPDGLLALYQGLVAHGITQAEIVPTTKTNPARLLELEPEALNYFGVSFRSLLVGDVVGETALAPLSVKT